MAVSARPRRARPGASGPASPAARSRSSSARAAARSGPFGPFGPLAELGAGFLEDLGAGVECLAQFVAFAGGVGAGLGDRVPCLGGDAVGAGLGGPQLPGGPLRLGGVPGCLVGQLLLRPGQAGR